MDRLSLGRVASVKRELQRFDNETGLKVTVAQLPPGTSKGNKIEYRLFALAQCTTIVY